MMPKPRTNKPVIAAVHGQNGQALTELLVIAFALIPLFLLVPIIGKYQDMSHSVQMASRYASFDAATRNEASSDWKPEEQLADEVRRRFFSNPDAAIKTNDVAGEFAAHRNGFWRDPWGAPLIRNLADVTVTFGDAQGDRHEDAFTTAGDGAPFNVLPLARADSMGLQANGIYTANVAVNVANLPDFIRTIEPFDAIDLTIRRHTSLVFNPWIARSPREAEDRFGRLVVANDELQSIQPLVDLGVEVFDMHMVSPPQLGQLQPWRDVVPADRLKPADQQ